MSTLHDMSLNQEKQFAGFSLVGFVIFHFHAKTIVCHNLQ